MTLLKRNISSLAAIGFLTFGPSLLSGCATEGKSLAAGGAIGAGTGAILGGIADPGQNGQYRTRNVILGTALGGMTGMVTGSLLHDNVVDKQNDAYREGQKSIENRPPPPPDGPAISPARSEVKWIEGHGVGNVWIDGHYERRISEPSHWEARTQ